MAILKLNSHEVFTQNGDNRPEFGAGVPSGMMVQMVPFHFRITASHVYDDTFGDITSNGIDFKNEITTILLNSKIMIDITLHTGGISQTPRFRIMRYITNWQQPFNATPDSPPNSTNGMATFGTGYAVDANQIQCMSIRIVDEPNVVAGTNIVYKLQGGVDNGATWYINRSANDSSAVVGVRTISTMHLMEIAA